MKTHQIKSNLSNALDHHRRFPVKPPAYSHRDCLYLVASRVIKLMPLVDDPCSISVVANQIDFSWPIANHSMHEAQQISDLLIFQLARSRLAILA